MDHATTSDDILAHFDRPKTLAMPDFEWVDDIISFPSPAPASVGADPVLPTEDRFVEVPRDTRRGVGWVLAWAGALAVIAVSAGVLAEFAYVLKAERTMRAAARAGATEATLPRATYQSVAATVERRLIKYPQLAERLRMSLYQNDTLVQTHFRHHAGDHYAVSLSGPSSAAIPSWLCAASFWRRGGEIRARAEFQSPGRQFASIPSLAPRK